MDIHKNKLKNVLASLHHDYFPPLDIVQANMSIILDMYAKDLPDLVKELVHRTQREIMYLQSLNRRLITESNLIFSRELVKSDVSIKEVMSTIQSDSLIKLKLSDPANLTFVIDKDALCEVIKNVINKTAMICKKTLDLEVFTNVFLGRRRNDHSRPLGQIELVFSHPSFGASQEKADEISDSIFNEKQLCLAMDGNLSCVYDQESNSLITSLIFPDAILKEAETDLKNCNNVLSFEFSKTLPNILIVDDDEESRKILDLVLKDSNHYKCAYAADGLEALFLARKGVFDVAVVDCYMPKLDGYELSFYLQASSPQTKVIFFSGASSISIYKKTNVMKNVKVFMEKPITKSDLIRNIENLLGHSSS